MKRNVLYHSYYVLFILLFTSCTNKKNNIIESLMGNGFVIDSTFQLKDGLNSKILYKTYPATYTDTTGTYSIDYFDFKYCMLRDKEWDIISEFDSLIVEGNEFFPEYDDMNGDGVMDFCFLAGRGIRGANYYTHLFIYDSLNNRFVKIKGFENVCAPFYNSKENAITGVAMIGAEAHTGYYKIESDTIIRIKKEVWVDDKMISEQEYK